MPKLRQFALCSVCRLNHDQGKGHKYSLNHKKRLAHTLSKFHDKMEEVLYFLKNPAPLRPQDKDRNKFWCLVCHLQLDEHSSLFACSNAIQHLASAEHMECLKSFWKENGADVQKRDLFCISQQDLTKVSCQGVNRAFAANLASQGACLLRSSEIINADQEPLLEYAQEVKQTHTFSNNGLLHEAAVGDFFAQQHSMSTSSASSGQDFFHLQTHDGYNTTNSLQDGYQALQLTCIQTPAVLPGEAKENIHTGAPPPWWKMDEENEVILSKESQTSADLQSLSKNQERKLKKMRNPKRVGASWAEHRRAELERKVKDEKSSKNFASDASWLPNFGSVWQSGSRKDSRREFVADRATGKFFVNKTENSVDLQPYISKRMRLVSELTSGDKDEVHR